MHALGEGWRGSGGKLRWGKTYIDVHALCEDNTNMEGGGGGRSFTQLNLQSVLFPLKCVPSCCDKTCWGGDGDTHKLIEVQ